MSRLRTTAVAALLLTGAAVVPSGAAPAPTLSAGAPTHVVLLAQGLKGAPTRSTTDIRAITLDAVARWQQQGVAITEVYDAVGGFAATLSPQQVRTLSADPAIASVRPNRVLRAPQLEETAPNATKASSTPARGQVQKPAPWGLDRLDQKALPLSGSYTYARTGKGVKVFIIDSGIRATHTDLVGRVLPDGYDGVKDGKATSDCYGHGTAMASIIAGKTYGVAKEADLVSVRIFDCKGYTNEAGYIGGLNYVASNAKQGDLVNSSLGVLAPAQETDDEVIFKKMIANGATVVASAGNDRTDACRNSPGRLPELVTVASSDNRDQFDRTISNYGKCVDLLAPGVGITSAWFNSDTQTKTNSGTSVAAPHVAGALALFLEGNRTATREEQVKWVLSAAVPGALSGLPAGTPNLLVQSPQ